jgi:chromosome segregation ATPase
MTMADRKKRKPARKRTAAANPSRQIAMLRAEVKALKTKLARESKSGRLNVRLLAEAKKARAQVTKQVTALRTQGLKLAAQLKDTLGDSRRREQARKEAMARVSELRVELNRRTDELRRKSEELKRLAQESAERAVEIIRSEHQAAPAEPAAAIASEPSLETPDDTEPRG